MSKPCDLLKVGFVPGLLASALLSNPQHIPGRDWWEAEECVRGGTFALVSTFDSLEQSPSQIGPEIETMFSALEQPEVRDADYVAPSSDCVQCAQQLLQRLLDIYGMMPYKLVVTRAGAIYAAFSNEAENSILRLEVDNDLDAIATVSVNRDVTVSGIMGDDDEERAVIVGFDKRLEAAVGV